MHAHYLFPTADAQQFNTEWESKTKPINSMLESAPFHSHQRRSIMPGPSMHHGATDRSSKRQRPPSLSVEEEAAPSTAHPSFSVPCHSHHHRDQHRVKPPTTEYSHKKSRVRLEGDRV